MAGARESKAAQRRSRQTSDAVAQERITLVAAGVLVAVTLLVAAGVLWGIVLPPRAHVLEVGSTPVNAQTVANRAEFLVVGGQTATDPIDAAIAEIKRDATLLQAGPADVGEVTAEDLTKGIRKGLAVPDEASADDYAKTYATFLKGSNLDKETYERITRAQVIEDRLAAKFTAEVPAAGQQVHAMGVTSRDQAKLKQFRDAVVGGADFVTTAIEMGFARQPSEVDFGWQLPATTGFLHDVVKMQDLKPGATTEVIARDGGIQFDVYRLAEREDQRTYTDDQKNALGQRKVDEWVAQKSAQLTVREDLSDTERRWITKQVTEAAERIAKERAGAGPVATVSIPGKG